MELALLGADRHARPKGNAGRTMATRIPAHGGASVADLLEDDVTIVVDEPLQIAPAIIAAVVSHVSKAPPGTPVMPPATPVMVVTPPVTVAPAPPKAAKAGVLSAVESGVEFTHSDAGAVIPGLCLSRPGRH